MSKIIVSKIKNKIITCLFDGFDLKRITINDEENKSILGNIYIAKVKNIVKNINAAFVEIDNGIMCYMELNSNYTPIFLNYKKDTVLKQGDEILVEVIKEAQGKKECVVTPGISIKGDHVLLTYGKTCVGISNKITNTDVRNRLNNCLKDKISREYGFIVRTKAQEVDDIELIKEVDLLIREYDDLVNKAKYKTCFSCVRMSLPDYINDIKEMLHKGIEEIVIEDDTLYTSISTYFGKKLQKNTINLRHYDDLMLSLNKLYSIESNLASLVKERVWLKSGGNIVIQRTEALYAIDVNTSKAINIKGNKENTLFKINKEAAIEIAKQISLRNIGGIIIIDFIDMKDDNHKMELVDLLRKELMKDYVKASVVDITKLNLVEVTRQKKKKPIDKNIIEGLIE